MMQSTMRSLDYITSLLKSTGYIGRFGLGMVDSLSWRLWIGFPTLGLGSIYISLASFKSLDWCYVSGRTLSLARIVGKRRLSDFEQSCSFSHGLIGQ